MRTTYMRLGLVRAESQKRIVGKGSTPLIKRASLGSLLVGYRRSARHATSYDQSHQGLRPSKSVDVSHRRKVLLYAEDICKYNVCAMCMYVLSDPKQDSPTPFNADI